MKKSILFSMVLILIFVIPVNGQGRLLNKAKNSITNEILSNPDNSSDNAKQQPEPACACEQAEIILELAGKLKLNYTEINISVKDDVSILVKDIASGNFYIAKGGVTQGPIPEGDPRIAGFENLDENDTSMETILLRYREYISKSGEKYLIKFNGKSYGPYAQINNFAVTKSNEKFAAMVIENIIVNEDQGRKMEEAIKNAKSEQERMDLAMKYTQQMQQKMMEGGGPMNTMPKLVTNIPNATFDPLKSIGGGLTGNIKYDDILVVAHDKIIDLQGKTVLTLKQEAIGIKDLFVNTTNTKYAFYNFGTLTFSDNTSLPELFNPHLIKVAGKIYLAYMYYSPKKNSIMQCKILF